MNNDQSTISGDKLPVQHCPICNYKIDAATCAENGLRLRPSVGDISICIDCGELLIFLDDFSLRKAEPCDLWELDEHQQFLMRNLQQAIRSK